jgi:hypothetical protein
MILNAGVKWTVRKWSGFEKSIRTVTQVKLILPTEEWKWTENIYIPSVRVNRDLCHVLVHRNSTSWCASTNSLAYPGLQQFCLIGIIRYISGTLLANMFQPASGRHGEREMVFMSHGSI